MRSEQLFVIDESNLRILKNNKSGIDEFEAGFVIFKLFRNQ